MKSAQTTIRPMTTMKTYVWKLVNNHNLQQNDFVKELKKRLIENNEQLGLADRSLGNDPKKVFCLHAVNPAVKQRFNDMITKGETLVYQGSGRLGFIDALYAYILTGEAKNNKPFLSFTNSESLAKHFALFSERTSKSKVVFRSSEFPNLRFEGDDTVGIFKRASYFETIPVEVAFAREAGSNIITVVSPDAALTFLEELYQGLVANHVGIVQLADALKLGKVESKHEFIKALCNKLAESSDNPLIRVTKNEGEALLRSQNVTLKAGAEVAKLLGNQDLNARLTSLQQSLGVKTHGGFAPEIKLFEPHAHQQKLGHQHT